MSEKTISTLETITGISQGIIKKIVEEDQLEEIMEILTKEKLAIDYLGYNSVNVLINKILTNKKIREEIKAIPQSFWDEIKEKQVLVYEEVLDVPSYQATIDEQIISKHQQFHGKETKVPVLVYQRQRKKVFRQ